MNTDYIAAWLNDQIDDKCHEFPDDFDFESAVAQLNDWFDDQIVCDHLDELLTALLKQLNT
jgi:hypothetical protein